MRIRSPSLVELHAFLGVVRHGNFHRAADELCVTQAAVSRAVARLEKHLGVQLLDRAVGGVRLTPAGAELRRQVEGPVAALEAAAGGCAERAVLAVAWAAFAYRLGRDAFEVPGWAEHQLARSGFGPGLGAYVTVRDGAHGRVRCCLGHHQQAGTRLADVLGHVLDKCAAQVPGAGAEPLENLTVTLLRPVASGRVVPAGTGPQHPNTRRWYAEIGSPSVGLGVVDATPGTEAFGGVLFLPSVWPEHPEWSWDELLRQLRLKATTLRGTHFASLEPGVRPYLIPSHVIAGSALRAPRAPRSGATAPGGSALGDLPRW